MDRVAFLESAFHLPDVFHDGVHVVLQSHLAADVFARSPWILRSAGCESGGRGFVKRRHYDLAWRSTDGWSGEDARSEDRTFRRRDHAAGERASSYRRGADDESNSGGNPAG